MTSTLADELKELNPFQDSSGGLWEICGVNLINLCMQYSVLYPLVCLCCYLSLFVYASIWICNDTIRWRKIPTIRPPRICHSPKLGKRGKRYDVLIRPNLGNFRTLRHRRSVRKIRSLNKLAHTSNQLWYEVGKGGKLRPIRLNNNTEWESLPPLRPTFDRDYGQCFNNMCNTYAWYLDAVISPDSFVGPTIGSEDGTFGIFGNVASAESDLYLPKGCYVGIEGNLILFDSGCTMTVTPYLDDFVGDIKYVKGKEMQGLSSITKIVGIGMVEWDFQDDYGVKRTIRIKVNYVPDAKFRLFSPQAYFLEHKAGSYHLDHTGTVFTFAEEGTISFNYTKGSILPFARGTKTVRSPTGFVGGLIRAAANLTTGQLELRNAHDKLGHYDIRKT